MTFVEAVEHWWAVTHRASSMDDRLAAVRTVRQLEDTVPTWDPLRAAVSEFLAMENVEVLHGSDGKVREMLAERVRTELDRARP